LHPSGENAVGDAGASGLATGLGSRSGALQSLVLTQCLVGDRGAMALGAALATAPALRELHLGSNAVGDAGAKVLLDGVAVCASLRTLNMANNKALGDKMAKSFKAQTAKRDKFVLHI
jgi:hypothetical protein